MLDRYGIWCRVSGGVTGTREAWCKDGGRVMLFDFLPDAERHAAFLQSKMGRGSLASFSYKARRFKP